MSEHYPNQQPHQAQQHAYQPLQYPQHQVIYQQVVRAPSNGLATAALILGICAIFFGISVPIPFWGLVMLFLAGPLAIVAVILGHLGLKTERRVGVGRGNAITGLVLGYLTLAICFATTAWWVVVGLAGAAGSANVS